MKVFLQLGGLNKRNKVLMEELNNPPHHLHSGSRREQFELLNKPLLIPLPDNFTRISTINGRRLT